MRLVEDVHVISDCWQILLVLDMRSLVLRPWDSGQDVTQWNGIMDILRDVRMQSWVYCI